MWLAVVMACQTLEASSCIVMGNEKNLWYTRLECEQDTVNMAATLISNGIYAKPNCFKVGESA